MSKPVVASSWVRADDAFLHHGVSSRIGNHRRGLCILRMPLDVPLGAASNFEDCASTSNPSVNGFSSSKDNSIPPFIYVAHSCGQWLTRYAWTVPSVVW